MCLKTKGKNGKTLHYVKNIKNMNYISKISKWLGCTVKKQLEGFERAKEGMSEQKDASIMITGWEAKSEENEESLRGLWVWASILIYI